jgi:hypothetical protein
MNIALLSCGPSLSLYEPGAHDIRIGVNRAVRWWACEWWVFGDFEAYEQTLPLGNPAIFCDSNPARKLARLQNYSFVRFDQHEGPACEWRMFSACAAMVLAVALGARRCDCFGCDMSGGRYFDGDEVGNANIEQRWRNERRIWAEVEQWAESRGCAVIRHLPPRT